MSLEITQERLGYYFWVN